MTFETIRQIIVDQLQVDESMVEMDTNLLKDLEADSLDAADIILAIEEEYDLEIPEDEAEKMVVVGDLVRYVDSQIEE